MPSIEITFDQYGGSKVEVNGEQGTNCLARTQGVELLLSGGGKVDRNMKPEADMPNTTENTQTQGW